MTIIFLITLFLFLSAFFSGSEIAFISANKLGVEVLKNKGSRKGNILAGFYDKQRNFISTMLVGNNIALVIFTSLIEIALRPLLVPYIGETIAMLFIITIVATLIVLIFGEYLPKTISRLYANEMLFNLAYPLNFFKWLLAFPTWIMTGTSNFILKTVLKTPPEDADQALTKIDLRHYINDSISEEEDIDKEILNNALNLSKTKVRDCMVPRTEIVHIDKGSSIEELVYLFKESRHSRILVTDGEIENVIGYVHHQQLMINPSTIKRLVMEIPYIPEVMNVQELMLRFIKTGTTIACVVDEFGGIAGIITLEDILEEIFGEIEDEHDEEDMLEEKFSEDEYLFSGRLEIDYLNEKYENLNFPKGDYHTLSGYIVMTSENIPDIPGMVVEMDGYKYVLESISDTKIETIRVIRQRTEENDEV
jgi:CBS domain containing-hemolysin-like protein